MAPEYELYIRNASGVLVARRNDFLNISISRTINAADIAVFSYSSAQVYVTPDLVMGYIIEIYRRDLTQSIPWTQEFAGIIRKIKRTISEQTIFEVSCVGMVGLLGTRIVAWRDGVVNRSVFLSQPAETVLKTLFNFNIGASATTANGRLLGGSITGMTTTASGGAGNAVSMSVAYMNLLQAMQKVSEEGGGDFDLLYTAPATWTYTWYTGQRGTNRTSTVRLSIPLNTVGELVIDDDRIVDFTSVIIGGTGEAAARLTNTAPSSLPTGLASREIFVDARNQKKSTATALFDIGSAELVRQSRRRTTYTATVIQGALMYGRDYFLGDLVTVQDGTTLITQKVAGIDIDFSSEGREDINVTLTNNN